MRAGICGGASAFWLAGDRTGRSGAKRLRAACDLESESEGVGVAEFDIDS